MMAQTEVKKLLCEICSNVSDRTRVPSWRVLESLKDFPSSPWDVSVGLLHCHSCIIFWWFRRLRGQKRYRNPRNIRRPWNPRALLCWSCSPSGKTSMRRQRTCNDFYRESVEVAFCSAFPSRRHVAILGYPLCLLKKPPNFRLLKGRTMGVAIMAGVVVERCGTDVGRDDLVNDQAAVPCQLSSCTTNHGYGYSQWTSGNWLSPLLQPELMFFWDFFGTWNPSVEQILLGLSMTDFHPEATWSDCMALNLCNDSFLLFHVVPLFSFVFLFWVSAQFCSWCCQSWNPAWSIDTILTGLLSFFLSDLESGDSASSWFTWNLIPSTWESLISIDLTKDTAPSDQRMSKGDGLHCHHGCLGRSWRWTAQCAKYPQITFSPFPRLAMPPILTLYNFFQSFWRRPRGSVGNRNSWSPAGLSHESRKHLRPKRS